MPFSTNSTSSPFLRGEPLDLGEVLLFGDLFGDLDLGDGMLLVGGLSQTLEMGQPYALLLNRQLYRSASEVINR